MDERVVQFRVGVMVLATIIITAILVLLVGDFPTLLTSRYTIYIHFPQARGVTADTPIRKNGLLIGRVREIKFADGGGVWVTAAIDSDQQILERDVARINVSLLGDGEIDIISSGDRTLPDTPLADGDQMVGVGAADPMLMLSSLQGDLTVAINSVANTSNQIGDLARQVNLLLEGNSEQISRVIGKAEQTLDSLQTTVMGVESWLSDEQLRDDLKQSLSELPETLRGARDALDGIQRTVAAADRNLTNLEGFTRPLGERGEVLVANLDRSVGRIDDVMDELLRFTRALNSSEGSLSRFINDPDLYDNVNLAAANLVDLTRQLRPILNDARAFSDKAARHPEQIGVGGLLRRSSGIK